MAGGVVACAIIVLDGSEDRWWNRGGVNEMWGCIIVVLLLAVFRLRCCWRCSSGCVAWLWLAWAGFSLFLLHCLSGCLQL